LRKLLEFGVSSLYPYFVVAMSARDIPTSPGLAGFRFPDRSAAGATYKELGRIDVPNMHSGEGTAVGAWMRMGVERERRNGSFRMIF
jgi:hypothetical protein